MSSCFRISPHKQKKLLWATVQRALILSIGVTECAALSGSLPNRQGSRPPTTQAWTLRICGRWMQSTCGDQSGQESARNKDTLDVLRPLFSAPLRRTAHSPKVSRGNLQLARRSRQDHAAAARYAVIAGGFGACVESDPCPRGEGAVVFLAEILCVPNFVPRLSINGHRLISPVPVQSGEYGR